MTNAERLMELCGLCGEVQPDGELVEVEGDELEMRMRNRLRYRAEGICCSGCSFGSCNIKVCSGKVSFTDQMSPIQELNPAGHRSLRGRQISGNLRFHAQLEEEQTQPPPLHGAQQTPEASSQAPEGLISSQKIQFRHSLCYTRGVQQGAPCSSFAWCRSNTSTC